MSCTTDSATTEAQLLAQLLREEFSEIAVTLRSEFQSSLAELKETHSAAAAAQNEALRTLTLVTTQSPALQTDFSESLKRSLSELEQRILTAMKSSAMPNDSTPRARVAVTDEHAHAKTTVTIPAKKEQAASLPKTWAQIRNELIAKEDWQDDSDCPETDGLGVSDDVNQEPKQLQGEDQQDEEPLQFPPPIDPEALSPGQLLEAFYEREEFLCSLIARFRRQQEKTTRRLSPEQLRTMATELPDDLAADVRQTLKQLDDLNRLGELELCLERARIARKMNQLENTRHVIEHNIRQLGLQLNPDGTLAGSPVSRKPRDSNSRRWLGKLGFAE